MAVVAFDVPFPPQETSLRRCVCELSQAIIRQTIPPERLFTMQRVILLSCLALLTAFQSAGAAEHKWFAQFAVGGGGSEGPFPIQGLKSSQVYTLGLGYNLTPHIALLPLEVSFQRFSSSNRLSSYLLQSIQRYQENHIVYLESIGMNNALINWPHYGQPAGTAELSGLTFSSGVQFQAPLTTWLSGFTRLGAIAMRSELTTVSSGAEFSGMNRTLTQSSMHYGFWLGAGVEHELRSGVSLFAALNYDRLYRHVDQAQNTYIFTQERGHVFGRIVPDSRAHFYNFSLGLKIGI